MSLFHPNKGLHVQAIARQSAPGQIDRPSQLPTGDRFDSKLLRRIILQVLPGYRSRDCGSGVGLGLYMPIIVFS